MTASDILKIAGTVALTQLAVDLLARRLVFSREPYQRAVSAFERARLKRDKILATVAANAEKQAKQESESKKRSTSIINKKGRGGGGEAGSSAAEKNAKKVQRAEDDCAEAAAEVARRHTAPTFFGSILFVILYRILSAEYSGKVVAVLPFRPWGIVQRLSMRGVEIGEGLSFVPPPIVDGARAAVSHPTQACAFLFIYILSTMSVKALVHKLVGVKPPRGADGGVSTMLDAPKSQRMLQSLGVDTEELKEARSVWK